MNEIGHYPHLFSPFALGSLALKNRVVMAPMSTSLGGIDGAVTPENIAFYRDRALGGFGLIIVEFTCVDPATGRTEEKQLTLDSRRNLDGHARLADILHEAGAKAFVQLQHGGRFSPARLLPDGITRGPSEVRSRKNPAKVSVQPFSHEQIVGLVEAFGRTAALATEAGYDGVELHGAHGYLLSQFLSPFSNTRDDEWGGDEARRLAFPLAVIRSVRQAIGSLPFSFRISADEFMPGGLSLDDTARIVPHLVDAGVDIIHASTGRGPETFDKVMEAMSAPEGWRLPYARRLREAAKVPVIGVGQIRWPETADLAIATGDCDLVALGRPSLTDPAWPAKAKAGRRSQIIPCTTCNWCISGATPHVACAENPRTGFELERPQPIAAGPGGTALVVGAGPGGIAAALMLDQAGYATRLVEASDNLGGGLIASATPPGKDKLFWYLDYLLERLSDSNVSVSTGTTASADDIRAIAPDLVLVATGTVSRPASFEGAQDMVVDAYDVLTGQYGLDVGHADRYLVYGGGETGCETAEFLAARGARVTLVTRSPVDKLARSAELVYRSGLVARLIANPAIEILADTEVVGLAPGSVRVRGHGGELRTIEATAMLLAQGRNSNDALVKALQDGGIACRAVGDAVQPGRIGDAVHSAYAAVADLISAHARQAAHGRPVAAGEQINALQA